MQIITRPAKLRDVDAIIPFIKMASGGLSEFLLGDIIADVSPDTFIEMALTDENTTYHYHYMMVAESDHKIIAAANYYPAELHGLPDIMRSFIAKEKLEIIQPYLDSRVDGSMYINTLAVDEAYQNTACGLILGKRIEQVAREKHHWCLSAHVWVENTVLYQNMLKSGFKEVEHVSVEHPSLQYQGGMVLLRSPSFATVMT